MITDNVALNVLIMVGSWWVIGFVPSVWLSIRLPQNGKYAVWGDVGTAVLVAFGGPLVCLLIVIGAVVTADFWQRPIRRRK